MSDGKTERRPIKTLERVLSKAGLGSRSEARCLTGAGSVRVNEKVAEHCAQEQEYVGR